MLKVCKLVEVVGTAGFSGGKVGSHSIDGACERKGLRRALQLLLAAIKEKKDQRMISLNPLLLAGGERVKIGKAKKGLIQVSDRRCW